MQVYIDFIFGDTTQPILLIKQKKNSCSIPFIFKINSVWKFLLFYCCNLFPNYSVWYNCDDDYCYCLQALIDMITEIPDGKEVNVMYILVTDLFLLICLHFFR